MSALIGRRPLWLIAIIPIAMMLLGVTLSLTYMARTGDTRPLLSHQGLLQLSTILYAAVGGLIISRQPRNTIGWLFLTTSLFTGLTALSAGFELFHLARSNQLSSTEPLIALAVWIQRWSFLPISTLPTVFVFLLFPDGHLPSRRWTLLAWGAAVGLAGSVLSIALQSGAISSQGIYDNNPFGIPGAGPVLESVLNVSLIILTVASLGSVLAIGSRFRSSRGIEREQMKWLVFAVVVTLFGAGLAAAAPLLLSLDGSVAEELGYVTAGLGIMGIAAAVGIAVLRYRLYDIDLIINRTLVYGTLSAAVVGIYLLIVGGLGLLFQASGSMFLSLLGVGIVAFVVQPARNRLQRGVNHLMFGERDDPYAALSRLGRRLESTLALEAVLPVIVETVAQTLKLPYAAISLGTATDASTTEDAFPIAAAYGSPTTDVLRLPLIYQAETIGALIVGPRAGETFSPADRHLLDDLARQAGVAVHAVRLTAELQHSRERLVTAREEERRRLRRDLHDGLGSQLAALHLQIDTLRTLIPSEAAAAQSLVLELRDEIHDAVADIRLLVYELRPPALDELGLAGAMRALAAQCTSNDGLQVTIEAPEPLPPLPAAVEVAAYRITQEALTNVVRHANAHSCAVRLTLAEELRLKIRDDGVGLPAQPHVGVGLRSMRERAAELGGTCITENTPPGGAQVLVRLPLALEVA